MEGAWDGRHLAPEQRCPRRVDRKRPVCGCTRFSAEQGRTPSLPLPIGLLFLKAPEKVCRQKLSPGEEEAWLGASSVPLPCPLTWSPPNAVFLVLPPHGPLGPLLLPPSSFSPSRRTWAGQAAGCSRVQRDAPSKAWPGPPPPCSLLPLGLVSVFQPSCSRWPPCSTWGQPSEGS